jgi:hypothetical protein
VWSSRQICGELTSRHANQKSVEEPGPRQVIRFAWASAAKLNTVKSLNPQNIFLDFATAYNQSSAAIARNHSRRATFDIMASMAGSASIAWKLASRSSSVPAKYRHSLQIGAIITR